VVDVLGELDLPMLEDLRLNLLDKIPYDTTVLGDGINRRALTVVVVTGVNVGCGDTKLGFDAVAFAVSVKAAVVIEPNAPLNQLQPMKIGALPFRRWGRIHHDAGQF
jgi:hypothetical protein